MVPTVLFVLLFIYYIGGVKTSWKQLQSESDFCDVTLVCDDRHIKTHKCKLHCQTQLYWVRTLSSNKHVNLRQQYIT